jgi:hypothetical protein
MSTAAVAVPAGGVIRVAERPRRIILYPFLAALYPVLALAAANGGELIRPADLVRPLTISGGAAVVAWLASRAVTTDFDRRALLSFVTIVVFSVHGRMVDSLSPWIPDQWTVIPLAVVPVAVAAVLVRRSRASLWGLTTYLNLVLVIMVGWSSASLLWHWRPGGTGFTLPDLPDRPGVSATPSHDALPNVFLIVLDKYTGHRSLEANYGFDNTPFEATLAREGFIVPRAARANYVHTFLALAAMLNWQYLDDSIGRAKSDNDQWGLTASLIEDNRTSRALRRLGYRFVFMPTAYPPTDHNRFADVQLPDPGQLTHEFEATWVRGTVMLPVLERVCEALSCWSVVPPYVPESAASLDWKFAMIPTLAQSDRPVFVLAHLIVPHEPYLYGADCGHRKPYWPLSDAGSEAEPVKAAYVAQIRCVNRKLEVLVREIISHSERPAMILLQADHGHGRLGRDVPPLAGASTQQIEERADIFAAYRLPGAPSALVSDSIGPVNAIRAVMRYYYGLDLPPLAEATYWSSGSQPYDFTRVR